MRWNSSSLGKRVICFSMWEIISFLNICFKQSDELSVLMPGLWELNPSDKVGGERVGGKKYNQAFTLKNAVWPYRLRWMGLEFPEAKFRCDILPERGPIKIPYQVTSQICMWKCLVMGAPDCLQGKSWGNVSSFSHQDTISAISVWIL